MKNSILLRSFLLLGAAAVLLAVNPGDPVLASSNSGSTGPQVTLIPSTGYVGDNIQLIGSGFIPDQNIIISIDGSSILAYLSGWDGRWQVMSQGDGSFGAFPPGKVSCSVPNLPGGVHIITAQDDAGDTATGSITVIPKVTISKLQGAVGVQVATTGSGLQANANLSISFNSAVVSSSNTDAFGAFTQEFTVPAVTDGSYAVKITDGTTTQDFSFSVQSDEPLVPCQLSPGSGSVVSLPLSVAWSYPVSFGITYDLQVSTDPGFTKVVLEKPGITSKGDTIADNMNAVSGGVYYWRVRAVYLGREAVGDWSATSTFRISPAHSRWSVIIAGSLAVVVLIMAGMFVIRLRKRAIRT